MGTKFDTEWRKYASEPRDGAPHPSGAPARWDAGLRMWQPNVQPNASVMPPPPSREGHMQEKAEPGAEGHDVGVLLDAAAKEFMGAHPGTSYLDALNRTLKEYPALADVYSRDRPHARTGD